ncbi:MAG: PadR family transcriptional regulator [Mycobacteriales bacterium]
MADKALNATAAALLGLLHDGAMTGGQLISAAQQRLGPFWTTTRSQVYRELPLLAVAGYVRSGEQGPRSAQPYAITATGRRAFSEWLNEPAGRDQVRNPLLLRVAFGPLHADTQLAALYASQEEDRAARLAELKAALKEARREGDPFRIATVEFAVTYHKAVLRWLESAPGRR